MQLNDEEPILSHSLIAYSLVLLSHVLSKFSIAYSLLYYCKCMFSLAHIPSHILIVKTLSHSHCKFSHIFGKYYPSYQNKKKYSSAQGVEVISLAFSSSESHFCLFWAYEFGNVDTCLRFHIAFTVSCCPSFSTTNLGLPRCKNLTRFPLFVTFCFTVRYCLQCFCFLCLRHPCVSQVLTPR